MSVDVSAEIEGTKVLVQALAYQQGLAQVLPLPVSTLSQAMPFLIKILGRQQDALQYACKQLDTGAEVVWQAAVSYFKYVYFSDIRDSHRVLGLDPWSTPAEVKQRYRELIRLFHPDRGLLSPADQEQDYAALINTAYKALSQGRAAETASAADLNSVHTSKRWVGAGHPNKPWAPKQPYRAGLVSSLGLYKLTPRTIWLGLMALAVLFVLNSYWNSLHDNSLVDEQYAQVASMPAQASAEVSSAPSAPNAATVQAKPEGGDMTLQIQASTIAPATHVRTVQPASPRQTRLAQAIAINPTQPLTLPSPTATEEKKAPRPGAETAKPIASPALPQPSQTPHSLALQLATNLSQQPQAALAEPIADSVAEAKQPLPAANNSQHLVQSPPIMPRQVQPSHEAFEALMQRFVTNYNNGNLDSLMSLFDDAVKTDEEGGKAGLRATYTRFFNQSDARELQLKHITMQNQGDRLLAMSDYQVSVLSAGNTAPKLYRGRLRTEMANSEGEARLIAFYHFPEQASR